VCGNVALLYNIFLLGGARKGMLKIFNQYIWNLLWRLRKPEKVTRFGGILAVFVRAYFEIHRETGGFGGIRTFSLASFL